MLEGKGTLDDPLVSYHTRLMDLVIMTALEDDSPKIVVTIEIADDLHRLAFSLEDFEELIYRGSLLLGEFDS